MLHALGTKVNEFLSGLLSVQVGMKEWHWHLAFGRGFLFLPKTNTVKLTAEATILARGCRGRGATWKWTYEIACFAELHAWFCKEGVGRLNCKVITISCELLLLLLYKTCRLSCCIPVCENSLNIWWLWESLCILLLYFLNVQYNLALNFLLDGGEDDGGLGCHIL